MAAMQKYVEQLVEQLRAARAVVVTPAYVELAEEFEGNEAIRNAEEYLAGPIGTLEGLLKIKRGHFPPDHKLSEAQLVLLAEEMLGLLAAHHYVADLPDGITPHDAYNALLRRWVEEVPYVTSGNLHLEFWQDEELAAYYPELENE
jgi:predicted deacetylase